MTTRYLLANWKSTKTLAEAEAWLEKYCEIRPDPALRVIVAPPMPYLVPMRRILQRLNAAGPALAVQDLSPFPPGSYTGAVAAGMVEGFAEYALLGHSERRRYFHETSQEIANKVSEAVAAGIKPILCLDQSCAREQLAAVNEEDLAELIIGYGPVEAAGIGIPEPLAKVEEAIAGIRALVPGRPILYGGSINRDNCVGYLNLAGVSGLMVASGGLEAADFAAIETALAGA